MTKDFPSYRKKLKITLAEADSLEMGRIKIKDSQKKKYKSDVLNRIKEKMFDDEKILERNVETEDENKDDRDVLLGKNEENDNVSENTEENANEKEHQDIDTNAEESNLQTNEKPEIANVDDLEDLANDTMLDVLQHIKELREKVKKENPEKAKFIRKIYDYLLKGKDKIASEIIKENQKDETQKIDEIG